MKRLCAFLLSALMLLSLWGCSEKIPPGTSDPSTTPSATKGYLTADIPETIDYHQTVIDLMAKMPEIKPYDGEIPEPYEPGRKVFITLDNQDCDFYPGLDFNFPFSVYTLEHYDVSQIQAKFDMQSEYTVSVREITDFAVGDMGLNEYKVFFGYDFYEQEKDVRYNNCAYLLKDPYDEMLKEVRAAAYADRKAPEGLPEYQLLQKHINGYRKLCNISHEKEDALKQEYAKIPKEELPTFYLYDVCITFTGLGSHEETVENAVITVGDEEYSIQFGQWRLHKEIPQEIKDTFSSPGLSAFGSRGGGARNEGPSTDGYVKNAVFFDLTIEEPLTLLGIRQMETEVDEFAIKDIKVEYYEYKDEEKVLVMDFLWDASRPLNLDKGEIVRINCDLQDPRFMEFEYCYTPVFFLDYEVRNREYSVSAISNYMKRDDGLGLNGWMRYFLHFEGIDIGEYYYYLSNYVSPEDYLEP